MKKPAQPDKQLVQTDKRAPQKTSTKKASTDKHPRCSRCGSRTVQLEQLEQELLVTLSLHCLICGHYSFLGRPVIRLLRRPNVTIPDSITRPAGE
jgi:hypothetical protein